LSAEPYGGYSQNFDSDDWDDFETTLEIVDVMAVTLA
jgi:hypothetical protein